MTELVDEEKICRDCTKKFLHSVGDQRFFTERELAQPSRCKSCRDKRRMMNSPQQTRPQQSPQQSREPIREYVSRRPATPPMEPPQPSPKDDGERQRRRNKNPRAHDDDHEADW